MKVVIQCAAGKDERAEHMRDADGRPVLFVSDPASAPSVAHCGYARPDDLRGDGRSWRDALVAYNANPGGNPLGLLPAYRLYRNPAYGKLARHVGVPNLFILSAGWGLLPGDYLTPNYDITFAQSAEPWKRRRPRDRYDDFRMADLNSGDPLLFFGGTAYLPLFEELTHEYAGPRIALFNTQQTPTAGDIQMVRFPTTAKTNWHYQAVGALVEGSLAI